LILEFSDFEFRFSILEFSSPYLRAMNFLETYWQEIAVAAIFVAATFYLITFFKKSSKGEHACGSGDCKCDTNKK
jgi:hypothetical protein